MNNVEEDNVNANHVQPRDAELDEWIVQQREFEELLEWDLQKYKELIKAG